MRIFQLASTSTVETWPIAQLGQPHPRQTKQAVPLVRQDLEEGARLVPREVHEDEPLPLLRADRPERRRLPVDLVGSIIGVVTSVPSSAYPQAW